MTFTLFPSISKDFIEALEDRFPDKCPPATSTVEDMYRKQGQLIVVAFLRSQFKQQNTNILEN